MTKHERTSRSLKRLKDTGRLVMHDPEVWRLTIGTLPNGLYEVTIDHGNGLESDPIIACWSFVISEVASFYTALEEIECI